MMSVRVLHLWLGDCMLYITPSCIRIKIAPYRYIRVCRISWYTGASHLRFHTIGTDGGKTVKDLSRNEQFAKKSPTR